MSLRATQEDRIVPNTEGGVNQSGFAAFDNIPVDGEEYPEDDGVTPQHGTHQPEEEGDMGEANGGENQAAGHESGAEEKKKFSTSQIITIVGVLGFIFIGAGGFYEYGFFDLLFGHKEEPGLIEAAPKAQQQATPRLTPMPNLPKFTQNGAAGSASAGVGAAEGVGQPRANTTGPSATLSMSTDVAAHGPTQAQTQPPAGFNAVGAPTPPPMGQPAATSGLSAESEATLQNIAANVEELQKTTNALRAEADAQSQAINKDFSLMAQGISQRFDGVGQKIGAVDGQMNLVSQQESANTEKLAALGKSLDGIAAQQQTLVNENQELRERIEALEDELHNTNHVAPTKTASRAAPPSGRINHNATNQDVASPPPPQNVATKTNSEEHVIDGFFLRGIARGENPTSAWVKTPSGFVMANVGQALAGAGTVKEIRHYGDTWEVVTTQGLIRP